MSNTNVTVNPMHVITGRVRLSYAHLFKPYTPPGSADAKYSVTILLPKSDAATKAAIDAAINSAIQSGITGKWGGTRPNVLGIPIHDGDGARPSDGEPFGAECKGCWVFTASSKQPPQVVNPQVQPILSESEVYSGMYARVSVTFFPYNSNGKKGVGCGLNNVQKVADGEPLGGRTNAEDDFTPVQQAAVTVYPQQPYQAQQTAYQPYQPQQPVYQPGAVPGQPVQQYPPQAQCPPYQPQAPAYPQQQYQPQIAPLTGLPAGGVMGVGR